MSKKDSTQRVLVLAEILVDPEHDAVKSKVEHFNDLIDNLVDDIETPCLTAFSKEPIDHLKDYGYAISAKILTRDVAKVIDLHIIDQLTDNNN